MAHPIAMAAQFYFSHFPVEKGKWRLWEIFRKTRYYRSFRSGAHRTRYGFSMNIQSDQQIDRVIYYWGCWEPNETDIIRKLLRPGYTFVDVGANDGYFSLLASSLVGESGKVIALEPTPDIAAELRANIHLNGFKNISVLERAASDVTGELTLTTPLGAGSGMTTFRSVAGRSWRVKADRLDVLLSDSPPPNVVKVDVEGAELKVLRGMEGLLKGEDAPHILCEVTASFSRKSVIVQVPCTPSWSSLVIVRFSSRGRNFTHCLLGSINAVDRIAFCSQNRMCRQRGFGELLPDKREVRECDGSKSRSPLSAVRP